MDENTKKAKRAKVGFILGLVSIVAWFIPIIGFPVTILAIIFSSFGLDSVNRKKAIAGLVLGIVFIVITLLNSINGAVVGYTRAVSSINDNAPQATTK